MTRARILEAARAVMAERGWSAATIDLIADRAGVASPTVYAAFRSKLGILAALRATMIDDAGVGGLGERAQRESDPVLRLTRWAEMVRHQMETSYDVIAIHREAARADSRFAAEYRRVLDNRSRHVAEFARGLRGHLDDGVDMTTATDIIWAFSNEELWRELVAERGWTPDRYEAWLAGTLVAQLLGAAAGPPSRRPAATQ